MKDHTQALTDSLRHELKDHTQALTDSLRDELKNHTRVLTESLSDDIRILADGFAALSAKLSGPAQE